MKALKEKNTMMEIKPKSRTDKQIKSLNACNNKLNKMGKELVENVLRKFSYLQKKTDAERKQLHRNLLTDVEKERRKKQDRENKKKTRASQPDVEKGKNTEARQRK